jgi:hypothetical protein
MKYLVLGLLASSLIIQGKNIKKPFDTSKRLSFSISSNHFNRFSCQSGRFHQIFGNGDVIVEQDTENGQVFIKPIPGAYGTLYVSFTTDSGLTQDVGLILKSKEPVSVCFKNIEETNKSKKVEVSKTKEIVKKALIALLNNIEPRGSKECKDEACPIKCPKGFVIESYKILKTGSLKLFRVVLKNSEKTVQGFTESSIKPAGILATIIPAYSVNPGSSITVVGGIRA